MNVCIYCSSSNHIDSVYTGGFFDPLLAFFDRLYDTHFARVRSDVLIHIAAGPSDALDYIERQAPTKPASEAF